MYHYVLAPLPYSGLISLDANFPEFQEWAHNSGKFILGCCMKFDCESLLQKLAWTQLCPDGLYLKRLCLKPWVPVSSKMLQSTIAAEITRVAGCRRLYCKRYNIKALRNKGFGQTRLYYLCTCNYCKRIENIVPVYKQASHLLPVFRRSCSYTRKLCVKCHSCEFFGCLDCEFLNQENFC